MARKCVRYKMTRSGRRCAQYAGDIGELSENVDEMMEYPPLEGTEDYGDEGIGALLPTVEDLKSTGIAGISGAAGMIIIDEAFERIGFLSSKGAWLKALTKGIVGVFGGKALVGVNPSAGAGLGATLVADCIRDIVNAYILKKAGGATQGLGQEEEEVLLGLGEEETALPSTEEELPFLLGEGEEEEVLLGGTKVGEQEEVGAITEEGYLTSALNW